jgi:hypothetical protein
MSLNFPSCERELRKRFSSKNVYWNGERITTSRLRFGESSDNSREQLPCRLSVIMASQIVTLFCLPDRLSIAAVLNRRVLHQILK